ncbi:pirin family protein [Novosphingobium album (ex Liu et al. 2023)]|uniref:Pirin family protein n=1 Tax=Novosphingobium album (ex Liu et al. 2023) TaxID=3031130 RepID=A0ABT5WXR4_9SPHN|nr:pirin family protein [Novosphingobium album (ex Liu et al. 2023)]MDE8654674.1 pirin family protein [Novosphingobium album (ex Liu et al. 2023)]
MKTLVDILRSSGSHWVGDGFPVHSLFSYHGDTKAISPFLLLDYAAPYMFEPNAASPRGVGQHPHRGFETVTIVYDGEVSHRDSSGGGGTIGAGDVQWMTAAGGIIHEEYHSEGFSKTGGPFHMVQLWVNLPANDKMKPASYQGITADQIPTIAIDGGTARIIAGELDGMSGPARTFSPINLWDMRLEADKDVRLALPEGHNAMIAVLSGHITVDGEGVGAAEIARLSVEGEDVTLHTDGKAMILVMTGEPIDEPVVGYGPFVMNSEAEIRTAIDDFNSGRFGKAAA